MLGVQVSKYVEQTETLYCSTEQLQQIFTANEITLLFTEIPLFPQERMLS